MTAPPRIPAFISRCRAQLLGVSPWGWAMCAMALAHAVWMSWLQVDMHLGLGTFAYDVGLYDQGVWLLSRGEAPFVTLMGRNMLGDHASLILSFVVPFFWVVPGTATLLVIQAFVVAAGAIPLYLFARRVLHSGAMGFAAAFLWLANPAMNGSAMENFHPDSFLGLFIPLALYAAHAKKWRLFAVAVVLAVMVKEDVLLVMVPLGIYVAWKYDRKKGLMAAGLSIVVTILGMFVLMRSLIGVPTRNEWRIPFGGVSGFIKETFTNPIAVVKHIFSGDRPLYLYQMTAPFAGLFLLAPGMTLVAIPVILSNIVSTFWYQHSIQYHYSIVVVGPLVCATVLAISRLGDRFAKVAMVVTCLFTLTTSYLWGQHSLAQTPRGVLGAQAPVAVSARDIISTIPKDAVISVYDPLVTFLAHRKEVYFFPNPFRAVYYGVDTSLEGTRLPAADRVEYVVLPRSLNEQLQWDWSLVSADFEEIDSNTYWQMFRRKAN
ncbi:MAG: DUF2079 domain-containing protein [Actinobacteria bacterium]|nr:DUF2079 domain-containing protein [Actinomycetota bacterium]